MAHVQKLYDKDGKLRANKARWTDPSGAERSKTFGPREWKKADTWAHDQETDKGRGTYIDLSNKTTVTEAATRWEDMQIHRASTARVNRDTIKNHIAGSRLGRMPLVKVQEDHVQAWANDRSSVFAPITLKHAVGLLSAVFNSAVRTGAIRSNPARHVKLPKVEEEEIDPLTTAQVQALADAIPDRNRAMVIAQAGLGMRIGELLGLRVQDVNFLKREVRIAEQLTGGTDGTKPHRAPVKNSKPRTVPLPRVVADELSAHIAKYPPLEDGSLFSAWKRGRQPYWRSHYSEILKRAVIKAGLPDDTTSHDLRHHYASVLLHAGLSVFEVANRIGDKPEQVLKVYGHEMPNSEDRTRNAIDKAWSDVA